MHNLKLSQVIPMLDVDTFIELGTHALVLFSYFDAVLEQDQFKTISLEEIFNSVGTNNTTFYKSIKKLIENGLISVRQNKGFQSSYGRGPRLLELDSKRSLNG